MVFLVEVDNNILLSSYLVITKLMTLENNPTFNKNQPIVILLDRNNMHLR